MSVRVELKEKKVSFEDYLRKIEDLEEEVIRIEVRDSSAAFD